MKKFINKLSFRDVVIIFVVCTWLFPLSCKKNDLIQNPPKSSFQLTLIDATCKEAWLKLSYTGEFGPLVSVRRNGVNIKSFNIFTNDTTFVDEGLVPGKTYTYIAQLANNLFFSTQLELRTLDSTTHNFTWQTYTLGDGTGNSELYDVAIINDTLTYAVGGIYHRDSSGQSDPLPYNLVIWNGNDWKIQKLNYAGSPPVIRTVFSINEHDIWFDPWFHWDGEKIQELPVDPIFWDYNKNKIWGNSEELYVVGSDGFVVHKSNNGTWQRIESGTRTNINDVYGVRNVESGQYEIYCAVSDFFQLKDRKILKITGGNKVDTVSWAPQRNVLSIWSFNGLFLYAAGNGVYENSSGEWKKIEFGVYTNCIRGSAPNNVFAVGDFGLIAHFNGNSWQTFYPDPNASYGNVSVTKDLMVAVGISSGKAIVVVGEKI